MATGQWNNVDTTGTPIAKPIAPASAARRRYHRLHEIRLQQGISLRCAARRMNQSVDQVRRQEADTSDLWLSDLYRWQQLLEVPLADLLVDEEGPLSEPVLKRARMVRLMKTAAAILSSSESEAVRRMAQMLVDQLVEIMPELKEVSPWHAVGQRRTLDEVGRIAENPMPDNFFHDTTI